MIIKSSPALLLVVAVTVILLVSMPSCKKDEGPATPPSPSPCAASDTTRYGTGNLSVSAIGAGDVFTAQGRYKPSSEFANDSTSMGVGGFVHDTIVTGKKLSGQLLAYTHLQASGSFVERLLVMTLHDTGSGLAPGAFPFTPSNSSPAGRYVHVTLVYTDETLGIFFATYEASSGSLTISSIDTCAHYVTGTFDGMLSSTSDTSHVQLTGGSFGINFVTHSFNY